MKLRDITRKIKMSNFKVGNIRKYASKKYRIISCYEKNGLNVIKVLLSKLDDFNFDNSAIKEWSLSSCLDDKLLEEGEQIDGFEIHSK